MALSVLMTAASTVSAVVGNSDLMSYLDYAYFLLEQYLVFTISKTLKFDTPIGLSMVRV